MFKALGQKITQFGFRLTRRPIGQILVDGGFISRHDLELALDHQRHTNELLGQILVRMGIISEAELNAALSVQKELATSEDALRAVSGTRQLLGEILIQSGRMTPEQLDFALKKQELTSQMLGEVSTELGHISGFDLNAALSVQQNQGEFQTPVSFRLGEILVSASLISREQLDDALERQKYTDKRIGEILVEAGHIQPHHVSMGLSIQKKLLTAALVAALSLSAGQATQAAQEGARTTKSTFTITAMVRGYADVKVLHQKPEIVVTTNDILRGYVDVPTATQIDVKSNTRYLLVFEGLDEPFREVQVSGLRDGAVILSSGVGLVEQQYSQPGRFFFDLSYRFMLSEDAHPGTYHWPLRISAEPM